MRDGEGSAIHVRRRRSRANWVVCCEPNDRLARMTINSSPAPWTTIDTVSALPTGLFGPAEAWRQWFPTWQWRHGASTHSRSEARLYQRGDAREDSGDRAATGDRAARWVCWENEDCPVIGPDVWPRSGSGEDGPAVAIPTGNVRGSRTTDPGSRRRFRARVSGAALIGSTAIFLPRSRAAEALRRATRSRRYRLVGSSALGLRRSAVEGACRAAAC